MPSIPQAGRRTAFAIAGATAAMPAHAQQTTCIHVGLAPGGPGDLVTQMIVEAIQPRLGRIILDHNPIGNGRYAAEAVKLAAPDGRSLLMGSASMMTMAPNAYANLPYDPLRDYAPIVNAAGFDLALLVHRDVPVRDMAGFLAWARPRGDTIGYASYGEATPSHLLGVMLNRAAGLRMLHVPYEGAEPARRDLRAGLVPVMFDSLPGALQSSASGTARILATSGRVRSPLTVEFPTLMESGMAEVAASAWFAYFAPIRTPPDILARLVGEFSIATTTPAFRERMRTAGMFAIAEGPVALAQTLRDELHHWGRVMRSVDFTAHR